MSRRKGTFTDFSEQLSEDLEKFFRNDTKCTPRDLMNFHRIICDLCCTDLFESRRSQESGKKVYHAIANFLTTHVRSIVGELEPINDEQELLCEYVRCWQSYQTSVTVLDIGCSYMNRNWVKKELFEGHDDTYTIYRLAMITWKSVVFSPIDRSLINAIHHTMDNQNLLQTNRSMIYTVLQSIVDIFKNDVNQSCPVLTKMYNVFKPKVLTFFEDESKTMFQTMLESDLRKQVKHLVKYAIDCIPQIEHDLCKILREYLEGILKKDIEGISDKAYGREYVQAILGLSKISVLRPLADRKEFLGLADIVCGEVMNKKEKQTEGKQERNPAHTLAIYCNKLMQNRPSSEDEENTLKNELQRIVKVVRFLSDENKKFFTEVYFKLLNNRRIYGTTGSAENELLMISMLRKVLESDFEVQARIDKNSAYVSKAIEAKCQDFLVDKGLKLKIDLRIKLFKVKQLQNSINGIRLPVELQQFVNEFRIFWSKTCTHGLYIDFPKSWGELTMNLSPQKCYTLQVNTLQMALLLQFNQMDSFAVKELAENVGTSMEELIVAIRPLIERKLLIDSTNSAALAPTSSITVCSDYNKKRFINCVTATAARDNKSERKMSETEELDAAIKRIMEREKSCKYSELIRNVMKELKHRCISIRLIRGRIHHFLEIKYLVLSSDKELLQLFKSTED